jgi:hypothetical protein
MMAGWRGFRAEPAGGHALSGHKSKKATTVYLPAELRREARVLALHRDTTLSELCEQGLREVVAREKAKGPGPSRP